MICRNTTLMVAFVLVTSQAFADKPPSVDELLQILGEGDSRAELDAGDIIGGGAKNYEANDASLAGYMIARVGGTIPEVIEFLNSSTQLPAMQILPLDGSTDDALLNSLQPVVFTKKDKKDVRLLIEPEPTDKFNYSQQEIAAIKELMADYKAGKTQFKSDEAAAAATLQNLMVGRFRAYREQGLAGIEPYQRTAKKQDRPAEQFRDAMGELPNRTNYFPDFIKALKKYPNVQISQPYEHVYSLTIEEAEGRVLYTLNHAMIEEADNYALIMQRKFYLTHTLEMLSSITLMVQDEQGTVVAILAQTATDKVSGAARPIAGPIGRTFIARNLKPLFELLQKQFPN